MRQKTGAGPVSKTKFLYVRRRNTPGGSPLQELKCVPSTKPRVPLPMPFFSLLLTKNDNEKSHRSNVGVDQNNNNNNNNLNNKHDDDHDGEQKQQKQQQQEQKQKLSFLSDTTTTSTTKTHQQRPSTAATAPATAGRRTFFPATLASLTSLLLANAANFNNNNASSFVAHAVGLVAFPQQKPFMNTYHFLRVGTSLLEEDDIWSTNPLLLTNLEDALSSAGQDQIVAASQAFKMMEEQKHNIGDDANGAAVAAAVTPNIIKHSLAAACVDTANIVGRELNIGRD